MDPEVQTAIEQALTRAGVAGDVSVIPVEGDRMICEVRRGEERIAIVCGGRMTMRSRTVLDLANITVEKVVQWRLYGSFVGVPNG